MSLMASLRLVRTVAASSGVATGVWPGAASGVAAWGVVGYAMLLALAIAGLQPRLAHSRAVALMLFAASLVGVAFTAYLTYLEAAVIHAWCRWCLGSAAIIGLIFLCSIPGLRRAR